MNLHTAINPLITVVSKPVLPSSILAASLTYNIILKIFEEEILIRTSPKFLRETFCESMFQIYIYMYFIDCDINHKNIHITEKAI